MRRPWIKVETATPDKPEICTLATSLRMDADTVVGKLVRLWAWLELNRVSGDDIGVTKEFLDKLVGKKGFAEALIGAGWLKDSDGRLSFRNFERHNGGGAKIRALTAHRVAKHRVRKLNREKASIPPPAVEPVAEMAGEEPAPVAEVSTSEPAPMAEIEAAVVQPVEEAVIVPPPASATEAPQIIEDPVVEAPVEPGEPQETALAGEDVPVKKKRSRQAEDNGDQPMLF